MGEQFGVEGLFPGSRSTAGGLMCDMSAAVRWPAAVVVDLRIAYQGGAPEQMRVRIEPCAAPARVSVSSLQGKDALAALNLVQWYQLPGNVLHARCFAVLAVHWFGAIDMPPRIVGAPLWAALSIELRIDESDAPPLQVELQSTCHESASLRCRTRREQPWLNGTVLLAPVDADPLRAVVRHGLESLRPAVRQRPPLREPVDALPGIPIAEIRRQHQEVHP